jgi:DNA modification methylase
MKVHEQLSLFKKKGTSEEKGTYFSDPSFASNKTLPIHRWVPWIAGFSSDFVSGVIERYLSGQGTVLDPFAGVGTTLVEAIKSGHNAIGFEINPYAVMASRLKLDARRLAPGELREAVERFRCFCRETIPNGYEPDSEPPPGFRTRKAFYSPTVLRKVLIVRDFIASMKNEALQDAFRLAFASTMVSYSNYSYEPSLGTRSAAGREDIEDFPVADTIEAKLTDMVTDIEWLRTSTRARPDLDAQVVHDSFFDCPRHLDAACVDLAITSPPYLNNYHYIRNTRPHLYWLGFVNRPKDTKTLEHQNFGTYWQTVRSEDPIGLEVPDPPSELVEKVEHLRTLNPEKGVYGGHGWANYAVTYFNDSYRFGQGLAHALKPGARAFVVVGNSILQGVNMPTDVFLGQICERAGLELIDVHTPRDTRIGNSIIQSAVRVAKAKKSHRLYESVVELRRPE